MRTAKPTLLQAFLHRYVLASGITLCIMLAALLIMADHLALYAAKQTLIRDLREAQPGESFISGTTRRGGRIMFDEHGFPVRERVRTEPPNSSTWRNRVMAPQHLEIIAAVRSKGELTGQGQLSGVPNQVVWAARSVKTPKGETRILMEWTRVDAIRAAAASTYGLVIVAILLSFLVTITCSLHTARGVARGIASVAESGQRMANGDFAVSLPEQPTRELDNLSHIIANLASNLGQTLDNLHQERDNLVRLEGLQRQFVADASHELRAPLAGMGMILDAWRDDLLTEDERAQAVQQLRGEITRLSGMVEKLLDLSRIESGREQLTITNVPLAPLVQQVIAAYDTHDGPTITMGDLSPSATIMADSDAVVRILHNLLSNAYRFTPKDGQIRVEAQPDGPFMRLSVTDTGIGIPSAVLPRIWNRFTRSEETRAAGYNGTGLGL
ncbi:MAG TPA: HAMP domain-containing sensor histidine kinase, partial [Armatimonadota bacterium]|nr:HAMP domain-containing sensor histidine kinase [Armatimonadota bacterium]